MLAIGRTLAEVRCSEGVAFLATIAPAGSRDLTAFIRERGVLLVAGVAGTAAGRLAGRAVAGGAAVPAGPAERRVSLLACGVAKALGCLDGFGAAILLGGGARLAVPRTGAWLMALGVGALGVTADVVGSSRRLGVGPWRLRVRGAPRAMSLVYAVAGGDLGTLREEPSRRRGVVLGCLAAAARALMVCETLGTKPDSQPSGGRTTAWSDATPPAGRRR